MKRLINLLSDIQQQIEETDKQQADANGTEFENGTACGVIEGKLSALRDIRHAITTIMVEMSE